MVKNNFIWDLADKIEHEFSVTEISSRIKELLENNFGYIKIKGEISGLKVASSGHGYFNLKENTAILACTCWRPILAKIKFTPIDGMEVVARGKLSGYAGNSRYQLSVESLEQAGLGAFMQILRERQEKLEREGAVVKDIIHRISDRCPTHILIWPVAVQGDNAAGDIAKAIEGFNELNQELRPDVIIVARGGGSIEDLWAFNEEIVVRSVFNSAIPIISAVGHEVDHTLIDLIADKRAPTPTAAAEFAVPVIANIIHTISYYYDALLSRINQVVKQYEQALSYNTDIVKSLSTCIDYNQQLLDEVKNYAHQLELNNSLLASLDYKTVLKRGFALVTSQQGNFITSTSEAIIQPEFHIKFFDADEVIKGLPTIVADEFDYQQQGQSENLNIQQARVLEISLKTPIGSDKFAMKLKFYDKLANYLNSKKSCGTKVIIGGDFNIAPFDIDVYSTKDLQNTTCFTNVEKCQLRQILNSGFEDLYRLYKPDEQEFSWWDYRAGNFEQNKGMRIDMILASSNAVDYFKSCEMEHSWRSKPKPSDHVPIVAKFCSKESIKQFSFYK
ncbi:Exodeoxyribonuclease 7 large subunit [Pseudolycoriella hygida]|uniref:DNA-(apurinic or apyrimidinic site) endonuclease n=1 Tax=Pseudolycoriella hygida TaxID=35572 RepID=A0A9Q0N7R0_9DIPT|nr:Exodeoxyribonuclease 7 large subunit [Pseudolycoriella hygida]